jgi:hypothetical protein
VVEIEVPTSLPTGQYCDVIANGVEGEECTQDQISVNDDVMIVSMEPLSAIAMLAGN